MPILAYAKSLISLDQLKVKIETNFVKQDYT